MDKNPNNVIPGAISGALNAAKAAYSEPSVKRFVFTSSSSATGLPQPNVMGVVIKKDTWNEASVKMAWSDNPGEWGLESVYPASKTQAEQAVWKFYSENKDRRPDIVVNTGKRCSKESFQAFINILQCYLIWSLENLWTPSTKATQVLLCCPPLCSRGCKCRSSSSSLLVRLTSHPIKQISYMF